MNTHRKNQREPYMNWQIFQNEHHFNRPHNHCMKKEAANPYHLNSPPMVNNIPHHPLYQYFQQSSNPTPPSTKCSPPQSYDSDDEKRQKKVSNGHSRKQSIVRTACTFKPI